MSAPELSFKMVNHEVGGWGSQKGGNIDKPVIIDRLDNDRLTLSAEFYPLTVWSEELVCSAMDIFFSKETLSTGEPLSIKAATIDQP